MRRVMFVYDMDVCLRLEWPVGTSDLCSLPNPSSMEQNVLETLQRIYGETGVEFFTQSQLMVSYRMVYVNVTYRQETLANYMYSTQEFFDKLIQVFPGIDVGMDVEGWKRREQVYSGAVEDPICLHLNNVPEMGQEETRTRCVDCGQVQVIETKKEIQQ